MCELSAVCPYIHYKDELTRMTQTNFPLGLEGVGVWGEGGGKGLVCHRVHLCCVLEKEWKRQLAEV